MYSNSTQQATTDGKNSCDSLSSYIFGTFGTLTDPNTSVATKLETASRIEPFVGDDDAYVSFSGESHQAHLPALTNWNGNSGLRKGYTLLMWIRPRLKESTNETSGPVGIDTIKDELHDQRVFYRFSTAMDDSGGTGICVVCSQWKAVPLEENGYSGQQTTGVKKRQLETVLTAYTLPRFPPSQISLFGSISSRTQYVQQPLILTEGEWHLLGFSHTHPYLKAATWSVTVNGRLMGSDNLPYPILPENHHVTSMEYCSLFQNISKSGALLTDLTEIDHKPDYEKTASQLQAEAASDCLDSTTPNSFQRKLDLIIDVAAVSLYADKSIPLACLAVAAEAGPALALQKAGRVLPTLPPVANWTKGASLEGPKVGIPLAVHSSALTLQQLSSAPNLVFCCSAIAARVLGSPDTRNTRLVCTMQLQPASTFETPRVGLVQPAAPLRIAEDELPCLYVVGNVKLYHGVSQLLLHAPEDVAEQLLANLDQTTKNLSVALLEQEMLSTFVRPFFLSLCPPGKIFDMHLGMYVESLHHLHDLYSNDAKYGERLIHLFAIGIRSGGGRVHEEVLQSGLIHVLASSLRLSLQRATKLKLFHDTMPPSRIEFVQKVQKMFPDETNIAGSQQRTAASPSFIPDAIIRACYELIDVCCGPPQIFVENLSPHHQIRRTSDLALTAIFGLALDLDLWGAYPKAASAMVDSVALRYGGVCVTSGYVMRSQISVQHFLDMVRLRFDDSTYSQEAPAPHYVQESAASLSILLQAMLLSSLTNIRSISQGENDIAACVSALTYSSLGTVAAHMVLNALVGVLAWCDVLPIETASTIPTGTTSEFVHEQDKTKIASRLGRNILVSQFHDVVAPLILSRTVFSGDRGATFSSKVASQQSTGNEPISRGDLCWQKHWRLSLMMFSWLASIAGPEGVSATKSCGSLLLASSHAGSLEGVLEKSDKVFISTLFLPSPSMSLFIGSNLRNEWSYSDLLSDRLEIMIPLLPALTMALLSHIPLTLETKYSEDNVAPTDSLKVLSEIMTAVAGAFHRVFGGVIHLSSSGSTGLIHGSNRKRSVSVSGDIKAAKAHVPNLVMVALVIEYNLVMRATTGQNESPVPIFKSRLSDDVHRNENQVESWMDVTSTGNEMLLNEIAATLPTDDTINQQSLLQFLRCCQKNVDNTAAGLISNAMDLGGSGAAVPLWELVITTIQNFAVYSGMPQFGQKSTSAPSDTHIDNDTNTANTEILSSKEPAGDLMFSKVSRNVLCRLISEVIFKALRRTSQRDIWSYELCSSMAHLCSLVEETSLLTYHVNKELSDSLNCEQIVLICVILDLLSYGRDSTGWCQIALPSLPIESGQGGLSNDSMTAASKQLLPILRPCLRIILLCIDRISSSSSILIPNANNGRQELLLDLIVAELNLTLTAAIVGQLFSSARDTALHAMTALQKAMKVQEENGDEVASQLFKSLFVVIAEELRVRYENERRLRENAVFDAYEGANDDLAKKEAAEGAQVVEKLILGNVIFSSVSGDVDSDQKPKFSLDRNRENDFSEDFVMFHDPNSASENGNDNESKLGFEFFQGLGSTLEVWRTSATSAVYTDDSEELMSLIKPFIEAWDAFSGNECVSSDFSFAEQIGSVNTFYSNQSSAKAADTAADTMTTFFEFAASEKNRLKEISSRFLPTYRYSRIAFAERFCWARHTESAAAMDTLWERGTADGNRDIRSRIPTIPCLPQFRRYLPKYLDNGASINAASDVPDEGLSRASIGPTELGAFTKSLLEAGGLEILDITKKQIEEEDESELRVSTSSMEPVDDLENIFTDSEVRNDGSDNQTNDSEAQKDKIENAESDPEVELSNSGEANVLDEDAALFPTDLVGKGLHNITTSSFSTPPDNASSSLSLLHSAAKGLIEQHVENCVHVKAEGNRQCTMLLTSSHLILEFDGNPEGFFEGEILAHQEEADRLRMIDEVGSSKENDRDDIFNQKLDRRHRELAALRSKSIRWNLTEVSHIYLRRYRLRDTALEIFFIPTGSTSFGGYGIFSPSSSLYLDFGPGYEGITRRDDAAFAIMRRAPSQAIKQWPDRSEQFMHDQLNRLTLGWVEGRITNFDYLLHLNILSGRSYNDICQYPVFPWVLSNYTSEEIPDLTDKANFRDLSKPIGALNEDRLKDFLDRFQTFADPSIPPFMYGSHYSTSAGVVLHFLVRLHPYAGLHRQLQGGHFDVADRLFSSVPRTWSMCTGSSAGEVKELTPEWYCNPTFLRNINDFKLGSSQDGEIVHDVVLPPWANGSPEKFVEVMRAALESDICSNMLNSWIDLVFGRKQQGPAAIEAHNVFFYLTYYGTVDVASIEDESLRHATELQIAHFGQCPMQLFRRNHVKRLPKDCHYLSLFQVYSTFSQRRDLGKVTNTKSDSTMEPTNRSRLHSIFGEPLFLPFFSAPLSHWVHLDAPPPGPHSPMTAVRFAGVDTFLAIDSKGVFHSFRWAWRYDELPGDNLSKPQGFFDQGCFIAQRELPRFRNLPRLMYSPPDDDAVVAISKTLFAGRTVLIVLSDGDGCGSLGMQLVDPAKGEIRGEVLVPQVHSARITCITTDPIGTAAGQGGVGGELCLVGSADGTASLWRFMSSHYLPLRPRVKLRGHRGCRINGVALCSSLHIAVTMSTERCCIHSIGNGALIRSFGPPGDTLDMQSGTDLMLSTKFAQCQAVSVSVQGFIVTVCETKISTDHGVDRIVITLHLFSVEGVSLGSTPLEYWRGVPHKLYCTPDGTAVMVCCGRGVTIHRLSACKPLEFLDEFQVTETDDYGNEKGLPAAWDIDFGPTLNRPVVAAAACSNGVLRLHALPGISVWSERHKNTGITQGFGNVIAKPARRLNQAVLGGLGFGKQIAGIGRDLTHEVSADVKERGVGGFLGNMFRRNNTPTK